MTAHAQNTDSEAGDRAVPETPHVGGGSLPNSQGRAGIAHHTHTRGRARNPHATPGISAPGGHLAGNRLAKAVVGCAPAADWCLRAGIDRRKTGGARSAGACLEALRATARSPEGKP